jgi:hypothetical protein
MDEGAAPELTVRGAQSMLSIHASRVPPASAVVWRFSDVKGEPSEGALKSIKDVAGAPRKLRAKEYVAGAGETREPVCADSATVLERIPMR